MRFLVTPTLLSVTLLCLQQLDLQGVKAESVRDDGDNDNASTTTQTTPRTDSYSSVPCGIWLAPSTITGAGLGMFAGQSYEAGQELQSVGDVVIPVVDMVRTFTSALCWLGRDRLHYIKYLFLSRALSSGRTPNWRYGLHVSL